MLRLGPRGLVASMCIANMLCMLGFATYPALLPELARRWALSSGEAGFVAGVLFGAYVLAAPLLTTLTDRFDARHVYAASALVAAGGSAVFGLYADDFWSGAAAQALFGIGFAGLYMPGLKALTDRLAPAGQARAVTLYTSLSGLGLALSYALAGYVGERLGWRFSFMTAALGPLGSAAIALCLLRHSPGPGRGSGSGLLAGFRSVFANREALAFIGGYAAHCWELYAFRSWIVGFLTFAAMRQPPWAADIEPATVFGVVSLLGIAASIYGNELAQRIGRVRLILAVMAATAVLCALVAAAWQGPLLVAVVASGLLYAAIMADSGALTAGTVAAAPAAQRGSTLAVHSTFGFAAGLIAPIVFGLVLDLGGGPEVGMAWTTAFLVLAVPGVLAFSVLRRLLHQQRALAQARPAA